MGDAPRPDQVAAWRARLHQLPANIQAMIAAEAQRQTAAFAEQAKAEGRAPRVVSPGEIYAGLASDAVQSGLDVPTYLRAQNAATSDKAPAGSNWSELLRGADPRMARTAMIERGNQDAADSGASIRVGAPDVPIASRDLAQLGVSRDNSTNAARGDDVSRIADPSYDPSVGGQFKQQLSDVSDAVLHPSAEAGARGGMAALNIGTFGGFNPSGLTRSAIARAALSERTGLGIANPGEAPSWGSPSTWGRGAVNYLSGDSSVPGQTQISDLARRYGVRVGGYGDPTKMLKAMESSIDVRRQAMVDAKQPTGETLPDGTPEYAPVYTPEQADAWAAEQRNQFQGMLANEGGAAGIQRAQHDATVDAVAGTRPGSGTVNDAYKSGAILSAVTPAGVSQAQTEAIDRVLPNRLTKPMFAKPGIPAPVPAGPGGSELLKQMQGQRAAAAEAAAAARIPPPPSGLPAAPVRGGVGRAWDATKGAAGRVGGWLGKSMMPLSFGLSLPTYLSAAGNDMDLYDTATDPNNEGGLAHQAGKWGTGALSAGLQTAAGEYVMPSAINAGTAAVRAGLPAAEAGAAPLGRIAALRNAARGVTSLKGLGGLARGAGRFAGGAARGAGLASIAIDAGANASAATRNLASGNFWHGGDETVRDENWGMANNAEWNGPNAGAWDYLKGGVGGVLRPTSTVREIAGAVDQTRETWRRAEDTAANTVAQQHIAPLRHLQRLRAAAEARGEDTKPIDAQLQQVAQRMNSGPGLDTWQGVSKWQQGTTWGGLGTQRGQLPFAEQYGAMDAATRAHADQLLAGVANGTVDPERARVALNMPAQADWSNADARDPAKVAANQRHVLDQANTARGDAQPQYRATSQWQIPGAAPAPVPQPGRLSRLRAPAPAPVPGAPAPTPPIAAKPPQPPPPPAGGISPQPRLGAAGGRLRAPLPAPAPQKV